MKREGLNILQEDFSGFSVKPFIAGDPEVG